MVSEWPAVILANRDMMGWAHNPLGDTWYEDDEGRYFNLYLHRDAARAWQAFREWCGPSRVCVWKQSEYDLWETDCGGAFQLNDGGPHDNDMIVCCYCGGALVEQTYEDAEVDDDD